jgi:uncharacterized protein YjbI with pentapeptide repeats
VIVTFYSYKGGVGRSMALANVSEILADIGYDVILCDFDLEAPGLEQYVSDAPEDVARLRARPGVVDLLEEYKDLLADPEGPDAEPPGAASEFTDMNGLPLRRPSSYVTTVGAQNASRLGRLRFLGAGARDEDHAARYSESVRAFDWPDFYDRWAGAAYLDFFREDLTTGQTILLVDSRTGVTEHGGVCTHHLADLVVLVSAPNDLNIEGTKWMANLLETADLVALRQGRPLQVLPVAGRVETASQVAELAAFRKRFEAEFAGRVPRAAGDGRTFVQASEIPYIPYFAFTEKVVARQADTDTPHRELYRAYEALSRAIVNVGLDAGLLAPPKRRDWASEPQVEQAERSLKAILDRHRLWLESRHENGERAVLRGRDFSRQELTDADLTGADLTEANFEQADLRGARLVQAAMSGAVLRGARLGRAQLSGADLGDAILANASLPNATLDFCDLTGADLEAADAPGAKWRGALLTGARLNRANLYHGDLSDTILDGAKLLGTDLRSANLTGATGLDAGELSRAITDDATRLPPGMKPGMREPSGPAPASSPQADEIVPLSAQRDHPALSEDFRFLQQELLPRFGEARRRAASMADNLRAWHGGVLVAAILGVLVAAAVSYGVAVHRPFPSPSLEWAAVGASSASTLAIASVLLPAYRRLGERRARLQRAADRLRSEYFLFLGRIGPYGNPASRRNILRQRVQMIALEGAIP